MSPQRECDALITSVLLAGCQVAGHLRQMGRLQCGI